MENDTNLPVWIDDAMLSEFSTVCFVHLLKFVAYEFVCDYSTFEPKISICFECNDKIIMNQILIKINYHRVKYEKKFRNETELYRPLTFTAIFQSFLFFFISTILFCSYVWPTNYLNRHKNQLLNYIIFHMHMCDVRTQFCINHMFRLPSESEYVHFWMQIRQHYIDSVN